MSESLTELAKRLEPLIVGQAVGAAQTVITGGEGPGIDIAGNKVGLGGDTILIYHANGSPAAEFAATDAGLDLAQAAMASGDMMVTPQCTFTAAHTFTAGLYYLYGTIFSGQITLADGVQTNYLKVVRTANDANDLIGVIAPASGSVLIYDPYINVIQSGAGDAVGLLVAGGTGTPRIEGGHILGTSVGGAGYGIKHDSITCIGSVTYLTWNGEGSGLGNFYWGATDRSMRWDGTTGRAYFKANMGTGHNVSGTLSLKCTLYYEEGDTDNGIGSAGDQYLPHNFNASYTPDTQLSWVAQPDVGSSVTLTGTGTPDVNGNLYFELVAGSSGGCARYYLTEVTWTEGTTVYPVVGVASSTETTTALNCQVYGSTKALYGGTGVINVHACQYDTSAGVIIPLAGDRAVHDAIGYPTLHTNDTDAATSSLHHTLGTGSTQAAAGDHTHAQLHDPVTVVDTDTVNLTLTGQALSAALKDTAVTPGSYTNPNISVDQQGRITSAENGSTGSITDPTTAKGDLLYKVDKINLATATLGATATAISVYDNHYANNVIDGNDTTYWAGGSNPVADDWIYIDLGASKDIVGYRLYQYPRAGAWGASHFKVQKADSASGPWTDISDVTPTADDVTIELASAHTTRYVRFYAVTGGNNSWQIYTIEIYEVVALSRLPIGTAGQVLTVDTGLPAWKDPTPSAHASTHQSGSSDPIAVDTLASASDNTNLNASATAHGLLPKLSNVATQVLSGVGTWISRFFAFKDLTDAPSSYTGLGGKFLRVKSTEDGIETAAIAGGGDVLGPATSTDGHLAVWDGTDSKTLKDGGAVPSGGGGTSSPALNIYTNANFR